MVSRYSSKAHQREGRISLFATTSNASTNQQTDSPGMSRIGSPDFGSTESLERASSPYESNPHIDYNAAMASQLESQNEETLNTMHMKISALKDLTTKMGDQINMSQHNLGSLGSNMESAGRRIRGNMKRMFVMAERSGINWKIWLMFFCVVFTFFFVVWLF